MNNSELKTEIENLSKETEKLNKKASKRFAFILPIVLLGTIGGAFLAMQAASGGTNIPTQYIKPAFIGVYTTVIAPWVAFGIAKVKAVASKGKLRNLEKQLQESELIVKLENDNTAKVEKVTEVVATKKTQVKTETLKLNNDDLVL